MSVTNFPIIDKDKVVTKYTDYYLDTPDFFIKFIQDELPLRDLRGLTDDRITAARITGEHPLVLMTAAVLSNQQKVDISGFLPAISVVESDENEEFETLGYGKRSAFVIDTDWITTFKANHGTLEDRKADGLLSDKQLNDIEQAVTNATDAIKNPKGAILAYVDGHMIRESVFVSVWAGTVDERNIVGNVVRSVIYDMRKSMINRNVKDIHIQSSNGLVNTNFGRVIHGREITLNFINVFHTVTVTNEVPTENLLDNSKNISIYDTAENAYQDILGYINANLKFKGEATNDKYIDSAGNEINV